MQEKYWASKVPLPLALLFVLNVFLVVVFQLLFFYRYPAQPDAAALAKYNSLYSDCTILNSDSISGLTASLVETDDGNIHLVVTKSHGVAYGRGRILYAEPLEMPDTAEQIVYVKNGIHTSEIVITNIVPGDQTVTIRYGYSDGFRSSAIWYIAIAAILEALELMVLHLIKGNLT